MTSKNERVELLGTTMRDFNLGKRNRLHGIHCKIRKGCCIGYSNWGERDEVITEGVRGSFDYRRGIPIPARSGDVFYTIKESSLDEAKEKFIDWVLGKNLPTDKKHLSVTDDKYNARLEFKACILK